MHKYAWDCDDEIRRKRGLPPRATRCQSCVYILKLVAHIRLAGRAGTDGADQETR